MVSRGVDLADHEELLAIVTLAVGSFHNSPSGTDVIVYCDSDIALQPPPARDESRRNSPASSRPIAAQLNSLLQSVIMYSDYCNGYLLTSLFAQVTLIKTWRYTRMRVMTGLGTRRRWYKGLQSRGFFCMDCDSVVAARELWR